MRLKSLEIFGFKTFFDKTVLRFQPGMTAIVGPNGCGKSNLLDAILWVLGEQSPKNLRGERMEDVIFNGTELRKPLGLAEVSLTFGDISNELPPPYTPYAEITISRRLYRSGESEYYINKTPSRLKDIRDLLIDTGTGYRSHTIIEQGKVDQIISASPFERREIIEEAAGIAKYRLRKAEALRKLDATDQNLVRVHDIIGEVKRQINSLDRQARKAEKYKRMKEELKSLELQVAHTEWREWRQKREALTEEEARLKEEESRQGTALETLGLQQSEAQLSLTQKEGELTRINTQLTEVEVQIQRQESRIELLHAQRQEWIETQTRTNQEIRETRQSESTLATEQEELEKEKALIEQALPEGNIKLTHRQEEADRVNARLNAKVAELEQEKTTLFDLVSRITAARNNLAHIQTRKEELDRKKERGSLEQKSVLKKMEQSEQTLQQLNHRIEAIKQQLTEKQAAHVSTTSQLKEIEAELKTKEERLARAKEERAAASAQSASREDFYRGLLGEEEGTENVLLQLDGLQGMIADLIEVPPRYEKAIEAVLENRLRGIVVEGSAEIKKGIGYLRQKEMGRGAFFPRVPRSFKTRGHSPIEGKGIIGRATDLITTQKGYEEIAEALLGTVILVTDLDAALQIWESGQHPEILVTLQGDVVDPSGIVSGGERGESGLLAQKREIRSLSEQIDHLIEEIQGLETDIESGQKKKQGALSEMEFLATGIRSLEIQVLHEEKDHDSLLSEINRLQDGHQTLLFEQEEESKEEADLLHLEKSEQEAITGTEQAKTEKEAAIIRWQELLSKIRQSLEEVKESVVQLKMATASLKEKQGHLLEKRDRISREREDLSLRCREKEQLLTSLQEKLGAGEKEEGEITASIQESSLEREGFLSLIREKREAHAAVLLNRQDIEGEIGKLRTSIEQTKNVLQEKALHKMEAGINQEKIEETILMNYQIEIANQEMLPVEDFSFDEAHASAARLRGTLEQMGPVNMGAIEEYQELSTRYEFLTSQEKDLTESMDSLREAIAKINKTTRGLFVDTFHKLNEKFGEVFNSFFGGGKAELIMLDEAHPLESGIELLAQPPGKKTRSITLLSGGEKALTAISLLFAVFLIHPSPFSILDEIDAPLDEENTRRFTKAIHKMSEKTQLIIITHNKLTMETADVLYGVTMEETGISKLVSVNLKSKPRTDSHPVGTPVSAG
ncbi:MAG: chromosome segregation protein SMC [Nitrospira sp.]|nr:chromosome segregation protein SMC [Candidatus Manganitrophaceae bacterium]HIL33945.1 chromosome segregation protein SMC [Candidatus Manganitrophaceae bacterium]